MSDDLLDGDGDFAILAGIGVLVPVIVAVLIGIGGLSPAAAPANRSARPDTVPATTSTTSTQPPTTEPSEAEETATSSTEPLSPLPRQSDIESALADAGFPSIDVSVVGREVTVSGRVADESLRSAVLSIATDQAGVESVIDKLNPNG